MLPYRSGSILFVVSNWPQNEILVLLLAARANCYYSSYLDQCRLWAKRVNVVMRIAVFYGFP